MSCEQCARLDIDIRCKRAEVHRLAKILSRVREDKRAMYLDQVKAAKAQVKHGVDIQFLHQVDCSERSTQGIDRLA